MMHRSVLPALLNRLVRLLPLCLALILMASTATARAGQEGTFAVNQVKAVFVLHITKFVSWPQPLKEDGEASFTIAVLGEDPFGSDLDSAVTGESVGGRPIKVKRLDSPRQLTQEDVDLLFVGTEVGNLQALINTAHRQGILTVGHQRGFCEAGGIVNLRAEDKRIRIEVNIEEAQRYQFAISAQVLRLARLVSTSKEELP